MVRAARDPRIDRRTVLGGLLGAAAGTAALPSFAQVAGPSDPLLHTQAIEIDARPIAAFSRNASQEKRVGALEFRGGLTLTSSSPQFGGWSGLVMEPDGKSLLMISDAGSWLSADLDYRQGRPAAFANARIGPLRSMHGASLRTKREQDAESVTLIEGTLARGTLLIGFERQHRIGRFPVRNREVLAPTGYLKLPPEARRMRPNQGFEALTTLKAGLLKGSVVAFAERLTGGSGYHSGWVWVGGEPKAFGLRDVGEFNITDAVGLPDGGMLVLERFFRWTAGVKMRIRHLMPGEVRPGAMLAGKVLLEADGSSAIDNMEGIAVHPGRQGELILSLISDDNFNHFLQSTIFLQFALPTD
jgi:hypothetical protein